MLCVVVKCAHGFLYISSNRLPSVTLCKDVLRKALSKKTSVLLLRQFENQFVHVEECVV